MQTPLARPPVSAALCALLLVSACDGGRRTVPSGGGSRTSSNRDATVRADVDPNADASSHDAGGAPGDAGTNTSGDAADSGTTGRDASMRDAGTTTPRDSGVHPDAAPADTGFASFPSCYRRCNTAGDCAIANAPSHTAAHYRCNSNRCDYQGCQSDTECQSTFMDNSYRCQLAPGWIFPACVRQCQTVSDCAIPDNVLHGVDNYACTSNRCDYTGCTSDNECQTALMDTRYACRNLFAGGIPSCVLTCNRVADCAQMSVLLDEDNYTCTQNSCMWTGCNSTAECTAAFMNNDYICSAP